MKPVQCQRLETKSASAYGTTRPDFLPEEKLRNTFCGGKLPALKLFSAMYESRHPASSPPVPSLAARGAYTCPQQGRGPRLGLSLSLERSLPLCRLIEENTRDGHSHCPTWVLGLLVHEESADHLHCLTRVMRWGYHIEVFISFAMQRLVSFVMESRLSCCTPSCRLCKDFDTLSRGCLGSLQYWIFRLTGS